MTSKHTKTTTPRPERLSGIKDPKDRREALETIIRAFTHPEWMEHHMEKCIWQGAIFDPEHTRVTVADGRVVSAVAMAPRMIRFGPVAVPAMTLGPVGTHDAYRKQGYSYAAMNDASEWMKANGVLIGYLQGIPDYYCRYGYYPYIARTAVKLAREDGRKQSGKARVRIMTHADVPAVAALYEKAMAGRTCTAVRSREVWQWLMGPGRKSWFFRKPYVIFDSAGKLCGYFTNKSKDQFDVGEIVVRADEPACRVALGALAAEGKRREIKEINLPVGWDDPLAVFIRQHVAAQFSTWTNPTGGSLMKIVDFPRLMAALQPLFSQRWQAARTALPDTQFTLECELGAVGFAISNGKVQIGPAARGARVRVPQRWMSGLLTGYYSVNDVAAREGAAIPTRLRPVVQILFPTGWPWVHQADNY